MTEMISDYLESQQIECKVINDGKEGLDEIKSENEYSVIFLDLAMPGFSGYDVFNTLKKEGLVQSKNIIIFTASSITEGEIDEVLANGAKGILRKPASTGCARRPACSTITGKAASGWPTCCASTPIPPPCPALPRRSSPRSGASSTAPSPATRRRASPPTPWGSRRPLPGDGRDHVPSRRVGAPRSRP